MPTHHGRGTAHQEFWLLGALLAFYAFAMLDRSLDPAFVNVVGSIALTAILAWGCRLLLLRDPYAVWGPMFWFRAACAVYFGIGGLAPYIANSTTLLYMQSLYPFTDEEVLKTNLINALAITCVMIGWSVVGSRRGRDAMAVPSTRGRSKSLWTITLVFLTLGGIARYGIVLPSLLGFGEGILTSIESALAKGYSAGLMLLIVMALRTSRVLLAVAALLVAVEVCIGVLLFNKTDVLVTILFVLLAFYHARPSPVRLVVGLCITLAIFITTIPIVSHGRDQVNQLSGGQQIATLEQRFQIVHDYFSGVNTASNDSDYQAPLVRISYVNAATMVVAWHDAGRAGNTFKHALAAFVPRFIWPDKPSLTEGGTDLYTAATGQAGTSISAGLFAEAYWNFGWLGVPMLMVPVGIVLALLANLGSRMMSEERWIFLPVVLMGVQVGTRADGHYVTDIIGAPFTIAIIYLIIRTAETVVFARRRLS